MQYQVTGSNRETGARMTLQFEADSRAAAERKAAGQGMDVRRVDELTDAGEAVGVPQRSRRSSGGGMGRLLTFLLLVAFIAAAAVYFWPRLRGVLPG